MSFVDKNHQLFYLAAAAALIAATMVIIMSHKVKTPQYSTTNASNEYEMVAPVMEMDIYEEPASEDAYYENVYE